jgi:hypothetical protein
MNFDKNDGGLEGQASKVMLLIKSRTEFYPFILKGKMLVHPN